MTPADEMVDRPEQLAPTETPAPAESPARQLLRVALPWLVSRLLVLVVSHVAGATPAQPSKFPPLARWDSGWYLDIAQNGYAFQHANGQTPYPFFPLLPLLIRIAADVGLPQPATAIVVNHLLFLVGLWGLYVLVQRHFSRDVALAAVWSLALWPGSAPYSMIYPSAALLAASVWLFEVAERGRDRDAGLLGVCAALVRPNGFLVAFSAALTQSTWRGRARIVWPSCAVLTLWMASLWAWTSDPLVFFRAKAAWREITVLTVLSGQDRLPKLDVGVGVLAVAALAFGWKQLPGAWRAFAVLWLAPPFFLGLLGMPRYTATCFPVFAASGLLLSRLRPRFRIAVLAALAAGLCFLTARITSLRLMP